MDAKSAAPVADPAVDVTSLADVMTRTLSEAGMDRMTVSQVEETLSCSALTAHY